MLSGVCKMAKPKVDPKAVKEKRKNLTTQYPSPEEERKINENINHYKALLDPHMPEKTRQKLKNVWSMVDPEEKLVVDDVLGYLTNVEDVIHFLSGAHMHLEGQKIYNYQRWRDLCAARTDEDGTEIPTKLINRSSNSSHKSVDPQFGLNGKIVGHILFGTRHIDEKDKNSDKYTWVQLENNPTGGFKEFKKGPISFIISAILHLLDFFNYRITGRNIGRWGKSKYTEKNPLRIDITNTAPEMASKRVKVWYELLERTGNVDVAMKQKLADVGIKLPLNDRGPLSKPQPA